MSPRYKTTQIPDLYDFTFVKAGSLWLLRPNTESARRWVRDNVQESAMYWGRSIVVEPRYGGDLAAGIAAAGFSINHQD